VVCSVKKFEKYNNVSILLKADFSRFLYFLHTEIPQLKPSLEVPYLSSVIWSLLTIWLKAVNFFIKNIYYYYVQVVSTRKVYHPLCAINHEYFMELIT